ncbi:MAG: glycosyltransferase family 39 protein [Patescibacteria group bacterium]
MGNIPYVDFFEHHGPLQYYLFSIFFYIGSYKLFPLWLILINSSIVVFIVYYIFSVVKFKTVKRIMISSAFILIWTFLCGGSFLPESYVSLLIVIIYFLFKNIENNRRYLMLFGFFVGLVFLIKFNAFVLVLFSIFFYYMFNLRRERSLIKIKNFLYFTISMMIPIVSLLILYYRNFTELVYWMLKYNFNIVAPLFRNWPPPMFSLFFLILIFNIFILCLIFLNKQNKEKFYKISFPVLMSTFLILLSYPLYGDSHLLVAVVGFFVAILLFFKERLYNIINFNNFTNISWPIKIIIFATSFLIVILICTVSFSLTKKGFRLFWPAPESFYSADFDEKTVSYIEDEKKCNYVYVYPAEGSNILMYLSFKKTKNIKFLYPNFIFTFTEKMQNMILSELIEKKVDCILFKSEISKKSLRSKIIERYLLENYSRHGEIIWREYRMNNLLPFNFITRQKINITNSEYFLLKRN